MNDKLKNKAISEEELDKVAGGTYFDSREVATFLQKAGYENMTGFHGLEVNYDNMRKAIDGLGFTSNDHGGLSKVNTYTEKATGKEFSQKEFMNLLKDKFPGVK